MAILAQGLSAVPPTSLHGIPDGVEGVRATLAHMARISREWRHRPEVGEVARELIAEIAQKDHGAELVAVFNFVRDSIRYTLDTNGVERLQTPEYTLRVRQGDCDDKSILLAALLESIGIPARFSAVGFSPDYFSHVYVEAQPSPGGAWIGLDATEPHKAGWAPPGVVTRMNVNV